MAKIEIPIFTRDILNLIKDSILGVIWTKKDLINFFYDCELSDNDMKGVSTDLTRNRIIDVVFDNLKKNNKDILLYRIYQRIISWSDFSTYWFVEGNLDPQKARQKITTLKRVYSDKSDAIQDNYKSAKAISEENNLRIRNQSIADIRQNFFNLMEERDVRKRGYDFEKFLNELFIFHGILSEKSFKIEGEQIDGVFNYEGHNYLIEAKWQAKEIAVDGVYTFAMKILSKRMHPRGVFFSINGYTDLCLKSMDKNSMKDIVLLDGSHIIEVIEQRLDLQTLINQSLRLAQTRGILYPNVHEIYNIKSK